MITLRCPSARRWASHLLAAVAALSVVAVVTDTPWATWLAIPLLLGYLMLGWERFTITARLLVMVSGGMSLLAIGRLADPWPALLEAAGSFVFLAAFMTALAMLRLPAYRSRLIRRCGQALLNQPPTWRYPMLSIGATLFGIVLNFGVLNLFMSMIDKANTLSAAYGQAWLRDVRRRRMLLATLRGFTLAPLISPLGIGVAVVLGNLPSLTWGQLFPYVLVSATALFLLGWACDQATGPRPMSQAAAVERPSLMPLAAFSLLLLALVLLVLTLAAWLSLRLPEAVLMGVPLGAWLWLVVQCRRLGQAGTGPAMTLMARRLPDMLGGIGNEVVALGSGAYLGYLSVALLHPAQLEDVTTLLVMLGNWLPALVVLLIVVLAHIGLNPIISVTFLTGMVAEVGLDGVSLPLLAAAMLVGWSLTMSSSPITAAMMITSRFAGMRAWQIGWRWNGGFLAISLAAAAVLFRLVS
ncbi:hypothetical protein [Halomonas marinisediminis]|uniref:H+/citrate symporter n=1 Tax=Halomonas marinisediminis TaxID=2546095 RepID=A0ABY2D332_9GAMM|nr:hypothetical protein [Halomonas marinisediminis]TDA95386.1 hypothetical protein E0702_15640 [Halomonas marinisediminis]